MPVANANWGAGSKLAAGTAFEMLTHAPQHAGIRDTSAGRRRSCVAVFMAVRFLYIEAP